MRALLIGVAVALAAIILPNMSHAYEGVTPGTDHPPPMAQRLRAGTLVVTWPGYQKLADGDSRYFFQTTSRVATKTHKSEGRFEVTFKRAKIHLYNNRHPLEMQFFDTPVNRVYLQRRGRDTVAVFELREQSSPSVSQKRMGDYNFVFVQY